MRNLTLEEKQARRKKQHEHFLKYGYSDEEKQHMKIMKKALERIANN